MISGLHYNCIDLYEKTAYEEILALAHCISDYS